MNATRIIVRAWLAVAAVAISLSCLAATVAADDPEPTEATVAKPGHLHTEAVRRGDLAVTVRTTGTAEPKNVVEVNAVVPGAITKFGADAAQPDNEVGWNSKVEVGTVLAYLDDTRYRNACEAAQVKLKKSQAASAGAKAAFERATNEYQRAVAAHAGAAVSQAEVNSAKMAVDMAKANADAAEAQVQLDRLALKQAQADLDNTVLRSPVKGVVIDRRANIGESVGPSTNETGRSSRLFLIAGDLAKMQVWMSVDEYDVARVKKDQTVAFTTDALPGKTFDGQVEQIRLNATMNNNRVTYTVVASLDNSKGDVIPYMTLTSSIKVAEVKNALLVPNAALAFAAKRDNPLAPPPRHWNESQAPVYVPRKGGMRAVQLKLGPTDRKLTEVVDGDVKEGTEVIVAN